MQLFGTRVPREVRAVLRELPDTNDGARASVWFRHALEHLPQERPLDNGRRSIERGIRILLAAADDRRLPIAARLDAIEAVRALRPNIHALSFDAWFDSEMTNTARLVINPTDDQRRYRGALRQALAVRAELATPRPPDRSQVESLSPTTELSSHDPARPEGRVQMDRDLRAAIPVLRQAIERQDEIIREVDQALTRAGIG